MIDFDEFTELCVGNKIAWTVPVGEMSGVITEIKLERHSFVTVPYLVISMSPNCNFSGHRPTVRVSGTYENLKRLNVRIIP